MITKIADNIISPLGLTSQENFESVLRGETKLRYYDHTFGLPEGFCGSLMDRDFIAKLFADEAGSAEEYSFFEQLSILSAQRAVSDCDIRPEAEDVVFVVSTTKGNVDLLSEDLFDSRSYLSDSAERIARFFGNKNTPIVVSNACISGACAQITAARMLMCGRYRYAVVIGCDVLSRFVVSGFQSFKALSPDLCRPYDSERVGLNLGEAAGTIILKMDEASTADSWQYVGGSIHNDANHISGPSRTGEGVFRVLSDIVDGIDKEEIAFVNAHGTATAYNDEMESIALHRANLDSVPVNGIKGYFGHTLGAAGVVETIISMKAVDNRVVLATKGFESTGTSHKLNVSHRTESTSQRLFIKILSGFGGSNAGVAYRKGGDR